MQERSRRSVILGRVASAVVAIACVASSAVAQRSPAPPDALRARLARDITLAQLVDIAAAASGYEVEFDRRALAGTVSLTLPEDELNGDQLWEIVNQQLVAQGFTTVLPAGREVLAVVRIQDAAQRARIEADGASDRRPGFVTIAYTARQRTAREIVEWVRVVQSKPGGAVQPLGESNVVLISDFRPRLDQILDLLARLDAPATEVVVEVIDPSFTRPAELVSLVMSAASKAGELAGRPLTGQLTATPDGRSVVLLCPDSERAQWTGLIGQFDRRQPVETRTYAPASFLSSEVARLIEQVAKEPEPRGSGRAWRVVTDELTGSLVVTATPSEHERIEEALARLEDSSGPTGEQLRSFTIRNRPVLEVLEVLEQLVTGGAVAAIDSATPIETAVVTPGVAPAGAGRDAAGGLAGSTTRDPSVRPLPPSRPRPTGATSSIDGEVTFTADLGTNTIVAVGQPRFLDQVARFVEQIDVRQPQIMLEVLVVGLNESDALDLGVEIEKLIVDGSTTIGLASLFGLGVPSGVGEPAATDGRGFTGVVLRPLDLVVVVRALQELNQGRSLNLPRVLVTNNEQAVLTSTIQAPFLSTNASTTVATTSFGGSSSAGTTLSVRPQIAEADHLNLTYSVSVSQFVGEATDPALPPPRQENALESTVTVPDGYVVALGGIELETEGEAVSQIPLVGDIPILGELFKSRSKSVSRTRFFVFIRPVVMRNVNFDDLRFATEQLAEDMEIDDPFPTSTPRLMGEDDGAIQR